jgi:glyoxylase-like metal-dependent hydrolase (beta-lactamase superfamily II)
MPIHILNCASMSPRWPRWHVGAPYLLVEADQGTVLVDTGLGLHDHESPSRLQAFAAAHPEVRLLAGHAWMEFFRDESVNKF